MQAEEILSKIKEAVIGGEMEEVSKRVREALDKGFDPVETLEKGLVDGIREMGERWAREEIFLPEVMLSADVFKKGAAILESEIKRVGKTYKPPGRILMGTVEGDIHDLGKNIVGTFLTAAGFDVYDLGVDVPTGTFVEKAKELKPDIIGLSSLLSFTMPKQREVIKALEEAGLRDKIRVIVGGAPITQKWADEIGADSYGEDVIDALAKVKQLLGIK